MHRPARIVALTALLICIAVSLIIASAGKKEAPQAAAEMKKSGNCETCHVKKTPVNGDSALKACPIFHAPHVKPTAAGPDEVVMNYYPKGNFGQSRFDHRAHAKMASMNSDDCWMCHHNQKDPAKFKKCAVCHAVSLVGKAPNVPRLKAAFHQQCLACHNSWDPDTKCDGICHKKNAGGADATPPTENVYPKLERPAKLVYNTKYNGTKVTFFHNAHADTFGVACGNCHKNVKCIACHDKKNKPGTSAPLIANGAGSHYKCSACHDTKSNCQLCHSGAEKSQMAFDHSQTGFPLKSFHSSLPCEKCHAGKIGKLDPKCSSCHKTWPKNFNHAAATGFPLSAYHSKLACAQCHKGGNFTALNTNCNSCHKNWTSKNFDHAKATGFALKKYHANVECSKCHGSKFGKLSTDCSVCHKSWPGKFDHEKATGLKLGENHVSLDCENCHKDNKFDKKPTCDPCHDGYTYPDVTPEY
jgi:hypothetical protein